ncbi:hypothetical protein [Lentibacillus sp. CBA3610]|uniref:hypothetical protein n=1 Tax=Lentibacillus sp. CBA3610 TaxID=2518176 RepID=UPI0015953A35|nr:hypothetical protein [Lentibacillus sp. CBA3610]QKY70295.1 hypothetical protein Len3610_12450 [Lentibacillus sp. CBA3610]
MKLIVIQNYRGENNRFPDNKTMKAYGHNIEIMYRDIQANSDINLNPDKGLDESLLTEIINFLSSFANRSRYYNLDYLTGQTGIEDPLVEWSKIQEKIYNRHCIKKKKGIPNSHVESVVWVYSETNEIIDDFNDLLFETEKIQRVQGHIVFYVYTIICNLAEILERLEFKHNLFPFLREFFTSYNSNMKKSDVIKKRLWI